MKPMIIIAVLLFLLAWIWIAGMLWERRHRRRFRCSGARWEKVGRRGGRARAVEGP